MVEKESTKKKREKYSWRINIDKNLRAPCKILASMQRKEVRALLSEIIQEHITETPKVGI